MTPMSKLKFILLLFAVAISLITFDFASAHAKVIILDRYIIPGEAVFPEGIAYQPKTGNFFVCSNGDGTIFRGNLRKKFADVFLPGGEDGRTTATNVKLDDHKSRLFVAGSTSGQIFVYNSYSGELLSKFNNHKASTLINDVAITPSGDAYFTDSYDPTLYKVSTNEANEFQYEAWLDFTGTVVDYQSGVNLNGIVASDDGKYLIVVQSNTGKLFRIDIDSKQVTEIDLGGERLTNGDGILLNKKQILYVVRNQEELIVKVQLEDDFSSGTVVSSTTDPSFDVPTTIAQVRKRLLVVNTQLDKFLSGSAPELPFTVSTVPLP